MNEYLQQIVNQYQEDQSQARDNLYQLFKNRMGKEDIEPIEIVQVDRNKDQEERTVIGYQNAFEPQIRDMIDTIHQITYHTGKILEGHGDPKDLETMQWYLEEAEQIEEDKFVDTVPQMSVSKVLNKTLREIPSMEELAEEIPEITNPENYQEYLDREI